MVGAPITPSFQPKKYIEYVTITKEEYNHLLVNHPKQL